MFAHLLHPRLPRQTIVRPKPFATTSSSHPSSGGSPTKALHFHTRDFDSICPAFMHYILRGLVIGISYFKCASYVYGSWMAHHDPEDLNCSKDRVRRAGALAPRTQVCIISLSFWDHLSTLALSKRSSELVDSRVRRVPFVFWSHLVWNKTRPFNRNEKW